MGGGVGEGATNKQEKGKKIREEVMNKRKVIETKKLRQI